MDAATIGLAGVLLGSGLTFAVQWWQHQWAVKDSQTQYERSIKDDVRRNRYERLKQKIDIISEQVGRKAAYLMYSVGSEIGSYSISEEQAKQLRAEILSSEGRVGQTLTSIGLEEVRKLHRQMNINFYDILENGFKLELSQKASQAAEALNKRMEALLDETLAGTPSR